MSIVAHSELHARFIAKVSVSPDCWEWQAAKDPSGYGAIKVDGVKTGAHRVAYELFKGKIADGLWIDHLCRNRGCVNPDHLEAVPPGENTRRGLSGVVSALRAIQRTTCPSGHPLTDDNLVRHSRSGYRQCLTCSRTSHRESMRRRRAAARATQQLQMD